MGWGPTTAQVDIEAYPIEAVNEDDDETDPEELLRSRMPMGTARAFPSARGKVGAGRPIARLPS